MAKDIGAPEPRNEPKTDPNPRRRVLGEAKPEEPGSEEGDEQTGIEIDNAIERPQEGQPGQPGVKPN